jgi:hypothetical protein
MSNLQNIIADNKEIFSKERTEAITEMFDNKDKDGLYPTTKFFNRIDKSNLSSQLRLIEGFREMVEKKISKLPDTAGNEYERGKYLSLYDLLSELGSINEIK